MSRKWISTVAFVLAIATSGVAWAQPAGPDTFAPARARIATGNLAEARADLTTASQSGDDPAARAIAFELLFVVDGWIASGGLPAARTESPGGGGDWETQLVDARARLVRGEYVGAARRLGALSRAAPHPLRAEIAAELSRLAGEIANKKPLPADVAPPPPSAPPITSPPVMYAKTESLAPTRATEPRWYGWQPLLLDAGAIAITAIGSKSDPAVVLGVALYTLGGPIVHVVHGRFGTTGLDLAARILAPSIGALIGFASCSNIDTRQCLTPLEVGAAVGAGAAILLDGALLSIEDVPREKTTGVRVVPSVGGVRGSF